MDAHQAVFLETGMSHKDNVTLSDWFASGVDDISSMILREWSS